MKNYVLRIYAMVNLGCIDIKFNAGKFFSFYPGDISPLETRHTATLVQEALQYVVFKKTYTATLLV